MVDNEEGEVSQISKLQMEIEQKNNVLLQLKAELEKQNDYQLLQEQYLSGTGERFFLALLLRETWPES